MIYEECEKLSIIISFTNELTRSIDLQLWGNYIQQISSKTMRNCRLVFSDDDLTRLRLWRESKKNVLFSFYTADFDLKDLIPVFAQ